MEAWQERTALLLGEENVERINKKHILVVGLGGVGAYAAEMLVRAGFGKMTIVDGDTVELTNKNRQLPALDSNLGLPKTQVLAKRFLDINPSLELTVVEDFIKDEKITALFDGKHYDYVVDAIDSLSPKTFLIIEALKRNISLVSAMGAGGKTDPSKVLLADISKTYQCPLAAYMRKRLKKNGVVKGFKAVFSTELPIKTAAVEECVNEQYKRTTVGTVSYMPAVFGCWCAWACLNDLIKI